MLSTSSPLLKELANLSVMYTQPHRHYHNLNHINFCLGELEKCEGVEYATHRIVTYAIWYHDVVYNPYSNYNEYLSEEVFYDFHYNGHNSLLTYDERERVRDAIRATANHTTHQPNAAFATQLMLDIDLAGLGQPYNVFSHHGDLIRKEYAHVDEDTFITNRIKFFKAMQSRPSIYYTEGFLKPKYEAIAQSNVDIEIKRLEAL